MSKSWQALCRLWRGQIVHFEACGMANIEANQPMALDTIFRIYSMSKPITSVAVLMLLEEGLIRLTDPVANYLPAFKSVKVLQQTPGEEDRLIDAATPITIHQLLTHTAGISYGWDNIPASDERYKQLWERMSDNPEFTLANWAEAAAEIPLLFQPGTRYKYGMSTDMLGALVQAVSGLPFAEFLQQRIFAPLGMVDTAFHVPAQKLARFATNYGPDEPSGLKVIDAPETSNFAKPTRNPSGGGGMVSTASDYLRFTQMLLNKGALGDIRLLGRKSVELMTTNAMPAGVYLDNDATTGYGMGLGVAVMHDLGKVKHLGSNGTYGWGGAANTNFWVDPQEELIGILMLQFMPMDTYPMIADFQNLVYQALVD